MTRTLLYVADPMCSWCWGFAPILEHWEQRLASDVGVRLVLGGLAPDDDRPMDEATRTYVQRAWRAVEARSGATFEHAFWQRCQPRRSTWPACRAVLAAETLGAGAARGREYFRALQRAYYTEARDPSRRSTLIELAREQGLDGEAFDALLDAPETHARLNQDFALRDRLGANGFPSVGLRSAAGDELLSRGWIDRESFGRALEAHGLVVAGPA